MPGDKFFMDTNIMVYHAIDQDTRRRDISSQFVNRAIVDCCGLISYKVVQECMHVLLKDNKTSLPHGIAGNLLKYGVVSSVPRLFHTAAISFRHWL